MNKELLDKVIEYIERTEETIDGEWGSCRNLEELLRDGGMPNIYFELKRLRGEIK